MQPASRLENWYTDENWSDEDAVYVTGEIYCIDEVCEVYALSYWRNGSCYQVVADADSDLAEGSITWTGPRTRASSSAKVHRALHSQPSETQLAERQQRCSRSSPRCESGCKRRTMRARENARAAARPTASAGTSRKAAGTTKTARSLPR